MAVTITGEYREQNRMLHAANASYGAKGGANAATVLRLVREHGCETVLDYGCGKAKLAQAIGSRVACFDPCIDEFAADPDRADLVVCADVMEHVEPQYVDAVLDHIAELARKVAWLLIATQPAKKSLPDGRNTHLTVKGVDWWRERIERRFWIHDTDATAAGWVAFVALPK